MSIAQTIRYGIVLTNTISVRILRTMAAAEEFRPQDTLSTPEQSSEATLADYTPEHLRFVINHPLPLIIALIGAYAHTKKQVLSSTDMHYLVNAIQHKPIDRALGELSKDFSDREPFTTSQQPYWHISNTDVRYHCQNLENAGLLVLKHAPSHFGTTLLYPIADPDIVLNTEGQFLQFWGKYSHPRAQFRITPSQLLSRHTPGESTYDSLVKRLRLLKYLDAFGPSSLTQLSNAVGMNETNTRTNHLRQLGEIIDSTLKREIAYSVNTDLTESDIEEALRSNYHALEARRMHAHVAQMGDGFHLLSAIQASLQGRSAPKIRQVLSYLANPEKIYPPLLKKRAPNVAIAIDYKAMLHEYIACVDGSIFPTPEYNKSGHATAVKLLNSPEFIRNFLLQAHNELGENGLRRSQRQETKHAYESPAKQLVHDIGKRLLMEGGIIMQDGTATADKKSLDAFLKCHPKIRAYFEGSSEPILPFLYEGRQYLAVFKPERISDEKDTSGSYRNLFLGDLLDALRQLYSHVQNGNTPDTFDPLA